VNSPVISLHLSAYSGRTRNLAVMKITHRSYDDARRFCTRLSGRHGTAASVCTLGATEQVIGSGACEHADRFVVLCASRSRVLGQSAGHETEEAAG
jgi:hypothetical protein